MSSASPGTGEVVLGEDSLDFSLSVSGTSIGRKEERSVVIKE